MSSRTCVTVEPETAAFSTAASEARAQPEQARLILVDPDAQLAGRLVPIEVDAPRIGIPGDDLREPQRGLPHLFLVGPAHAILYRPADGRPELERRRSGVTRFGKSSASTFSSRA